MASFNIEIPDEYLGGGDDFGFTTVDADEFEQQQTQQGEVAEEVADEVVSVLTSKMNTLEGKINAVLLRLEDNTDNDGVDNSVDINRLEEKIDQILSMENAELTQSIQEQGACLLYTSDAADE